MGASYAGNRYAAFRPAMSDEEVGAILAASPPGAPITVYYDPHDPSASMLIPGIERWSTCLWIYRGVALFFVFAAWYWHFRSGSPPTHRRT
jgi:hypothetical protein